MELAAAAQAKDDAALRLDHFLDDVRSGLGEAKTVLRAAESVTSHALGTLATSAPPDASVSEGTESGSESESEGSPSEASTAAEMEAK